ncbi:TonB-dependent receptor [Marinifilum sp.]|uniref:TonB-dependent receptor n=1 Tax=Marinifilum sp. TaxID=2033137 RepID=UPI003BA9F5D3
MKQMFIALIAILNIQLCLGQKLNTLHGSVSDPNGSALIGANVYIEELKLGSVSDFNGNYSIDKIPDGEYNITVSYIGYTKYSTKIKITKTTELKIELQEGVVLKGLIVTAQKRSQSIVEIPTALSSVSGNFIENTGFTQMDQLADYIPGIQLQIQSPNNPGFVVRGITSDNGAANIEPRVSVFQDGVSISKSRGSIVEIYDMERVEVLKGPQGTLFGRGAQIGAIHFIQNKAKNETSGSIRIASGNYDNRSAQGYFNTPLLKDKLFFRLAGYYQERDGYIKNLSGGNLNGKDTKAFRASLKLLAGRKTKFDLIYNYQKDTPPGTAFKSGTYAPLDGDTKAWNFADLDEGKDLGLDRKVWGITLQGKHFFNNQLSLTSISAYREFDSYESFDADGTVAPALWFAEDALGEQFSQEFRLNLKLNDKLEGFAGANLFYEKGSQKVPFSTDERSYFALISPILANSINPSLQALGTQLNPIPLVLNGQALLPASGSELLSNPLPPIGVLPPEVQQQVAALYAILQSPLLTSHNEYYKNYGENTAFEFFADGTYKLSNRLKLTAGLRLSIEKIKSAFEAANLDSQNANLGFVSSAGPNILFMPTEKTEHDKSFTSLVGRLALNYSLSDEINLYATAARGRRPNVIQFISKPNNDAYFTSSYEPQVLKRETVNSYELGVKGLSMGQSFYFDAATYYYDYKNFQTNTIDSQTNQILVKDAGNANSYGFECSLKWRVSDLLNLYGNYSYIHAEFDDKDSDGNPQEYAGNTFRLTPEHTMGLGLDFEVPLSDNLLFSLHPNYNYRTKVYFEESNLDIESQDAYGIFNIRGGFNLKKEKLHFNFYVNNAFDKNYLIDAGNTGRNFGIPTYIAGTPRFYGAEIKFNF